MDSAEELSSLPTDSKELVRRYQAGDEDALNRLVELYYESVRRIVRVRISKSLLEALEVDDIVQETFRSACQNFDRFECRENATVLDWLAKLAERKIHDAYKYFHTQKRDRSREVRPQPGVTTAEFGNFLGELAAAITPVPSKVAKEELNGIIDECIRELRPEYREVIVLRDLEGGSWAFVNDELKRPSVMAAQELHRRAKARLAVIVAVRLKRGRED